MAFNLLKTNWAVFCNQLAKGNNPFEPPSRAQIYPPLKTRRKVWRRKAKR